MDSTSEEVGESSNNSHPCLLLQNFIKAFLQCLGFDITNNHTGDQVDTKASRKPQKPRPNPGRGGQTNSTQDLETLLHPAE